MIKRINNTKTIAAPDTPVLHICHTSFFIFSSYFMVFLNNCDYFSLDYCFFSFFLVLLLMYTVHRKEIYMKKKVLVLSLCAFMLMITGCGEVPKLANGEEVVATVDGKEVTADEIYKELKKSGGTSATVNIIDSFIANKEIEDSEDAKATAEVQLESIKEQYGDNFETALTSAGYKKESDFLDDLILEYKKTEVVKKYVAEKITDDEIKKYYDEEVFGEMTAKHILIKPETTDDMTDDEIKKAEDAAKKKANDLIKKLADGADFAKLAKENSDDEGTASDGGEFTFTKDQVVSEFWKGAHGLKDGEYTTTPVKSNYGYHIILRVSQKEKPALEDKKDDIIDTLVSKRMADDANISMKIWAEVRKKYNLEIIDTDIKSSYDSTIKNLEKAQ